MKPQAPKILLLIALAFAFSGCEREWGNPFDDKSAIDPESWAPQNLQIELVSIHERKLSWQYDDHNIEGFKIDRKEGDSNWEKSFATLKKEARSWNDTENLPDNALTYSYRLYAFAGKNISSYEETKYLPTTLLTSEVTNITSISATSGGNVVGSNIDGRGIAFSTSPNPYISGNTIPVGSGAGSFTANITDLTPNTTYHVRAYATNSVDTIYGENVSFTTLVSLSSVITGNVTSITSSSSAVAGSVITDGGSPVTSRGIAYGTTTNPTISGNTVSAGSGTGNFTANLNELTPNTTYYVRAYATNSAGTAYGDNVTFKTLVHQCGTNISFIYKGQQVTYGTVSRGGRCWMDRNLGASRVPISSTDIQGYGDYFQWGRIDDGHQNKSSAQTSTLSNTDVPGHSNFIINWSSPADWRSPKNDNLWQGTNGINNPCPPGWRVPTQAELNSERLSWNSNNAAGAYSSTLKWPVSGYRGENGGYTNFSFAHVWSSSVSGTRAWFLNIKDNSVVETFWGRASGMSVRCVRD